MLAIARALGLNMRGIITSNPELVDTSILDVPVLGLEGKVHIDPKEMTLVNGLGNHASSKDTGIAPRAALYDRYRALGFDFLPIISPQAMVQEHFTIGSGTQIMPGAVIQPGANIGENVIINTRASIDHHVTIASHCHIAPGAVLCGHVTIGEATHVGAGAVIIEKRHIGRNVVIGAGAIVTRDIPDDAVVYPVRV